MGGGLSEPRTAAESPRRSAPPTLAGGVAAVLTGAAVLALPAPGAAVIYLATVARWAAAGSVVGGIEHAAGTRGRIVHPHAFAGLQELHQQSVIADGLRRVMAAVHVRPPLQARRSYDIIGAKIGTK